MTCVLPIDTIKVRVQLLGNTPAAPGAPPLTPMAVGRALVKEGGVGALFGYWPGLTSAWSRMILYGGSRVGFFKVGNAKFQEMKGGAKLSLPDKLLLGACAGGAASVIGSPCDLALVRIQSDSMLPAAQRRNYSGIINAASRIVKEEGVLALWRGATPVVIRAVVLNSALLAVAEQCKENFASYFQGGMTDWRNIIISNTIGGTVAAVVSLPFDMAKTRMQQMRPLPDGTLPYKNMFDCIGKIAKKEGVSVRLCARWLLLVCASSLQFLLFLLFLLSQVTKLWTGLPLFILRVAPYGLIALSAADFLNLALDDSRAWAREMKEKQAAAATASGAGSSVVSSKAVPPQVK
jgi:solute carrier family 25 (mitochondrial oxoglutarate transporter), member 11